MLLRIIFITVICATVIESSKLPKKEDYASHPCRRNCLLETVPRVCEYNFTLEHYTTLSHACFSCPGNHTDCFRPHCIAADGRKRAIKVANRMMPGPGIHVCEGDTIVVNVYNQLGDFEGTSIHWHGILQEGSPHMDGVTMVTQCPIPAQSMFQYRFRVDKPGTHYWHAHAGFQRSDGIFGPIVVRDAQLTDSMALYDFDLPEHTVLVNDWLDQYTSSKYNLHHHAMDDNEPVSLLINGRSSSYGVGAGMDHAAMSGMSGSHEGAVEEGAGHDMGVSSENEDMEGHSGQNKAYVPATVFRVTKGYRYRFRLISNGILNCPLRVYIESHNFTVIATDGYDMEPYNTQSLNLFAGERYDIIITANHSVGNYWLHVIGLGDCERGGLYESAILRYDGASHGKPATVPTYAQLIGQTISVTNALRETQTSTTVAGLNSKLSTNDIYTSHHVKRFYVAMDFNRVGSSRFLDDDLYPLDTMMQIHQGPHANHMYALQMNHITNKLPASPLLTQYTDLNELNKTITRQFVENLDVRGQLRRNLQSPVKKDTVIVPDGGYTIIRFKAINKGFWLFHCHVEFHISLGMSIVLQVGESHEMPPAPPGFPRCGSWAYNHHSANCYTSSAPPPPMMFPSYIHVYVCILSIMFFFTLQSRSWTHFTH